MNVKRLAVLLAASGLCALQLVAAPRREKAEKTADGDGEREVKTGWTFGALPCATYSSDMGFQWGAFGDVYYYGDGKTYPDPLHKISWEASHYTKGRSRFYLAYDSKYLIPKMRLTVSATYVNDPLYYFYGFNGSASPFYQDISNNKGYYTSAAVDAADRAMYAVMGVPLAGGTDGYGISYYNMKRNMFRFLADFQGRITDNLFWAGGVSYWYFNLNDFKTRYGYDPSATIYNRYVSQGVIGATEADGGHRIEFKGGVTYDSRDIEAAPNKGIWAELYLNGSPDFFSDGYNYLKLCAHWRHYVRIPVGFIKAGDPVFAYHLAYQGTLAGKTPFYMQQNITALVLKQMISEGFGSYNTVRGTYTNRIIADGYAWGNFELRVKLVNFKLFNQFFYLATNPFFDCGMVVQPYRVKEMAALPEIAALAGSTPAEEYVRKASREFIKTAGIGLKLAWNENFIVSAEFAHNFNKGLGDPFWMSIGVNYSF